MTATCETCRWWARDDIMPGAGGCSNPTFVEPMRLATNSSPDQAIAVLRFSRMTCGEHQAKEPTP